MRYRVERLLGRDRQALKALEKTLALDPRSARLCIVTARVLLGLKEFGKAVRFLRRATKLDPGGLEAWELRAELMLWHGRNAEAARCAKKMLALKSDSSSGLRMMGAALALRETAAGALFLECRDTTRSERRRGADLAGRDIAPP